jgi:hypothetical protein
MPSVHELEQMLEAARKQEQEQDSANRKAQQIKWGQITDTPDNWHWVVTPRSYQSWGKGTIQGAYIAKHLDADVLADWKRGGPSTFASDWDDGQSRGMFYYRTRENILTHEGGGHCVLNDPMLCNDEEWEKILAGVIPLKYRA